ncbi:transposable element-related [Anaeramoeba flamelloides]|uniref:Transposable element-related n=1 Tax=Anaeramoeba flamelloides TaxID=1746091 RepID=A0AAV7ZJ89_9EUKA|nr:transposable element-related [Anaeramoeba flamelloides]
MSCKELSTYLKEEYNVSKGRTTVWKIRKDLNFEYLLPRKRTLLTTKQKKKRLKLVRKYINNLIDWKKVKFTDEKWFYYTGLNRKIWRQKGEKDDSVFNNLQTPKLFLIFFYQTFCKSETDCNSQTYQNNVISRSKIFSDMDELYGKNQWILMQDGATSHTSLSTLEYLKNKCQVLKKWPSKFARFQPNRTLMGYYVQKNSDNPQKNKNQLIKCCRDVWKSLKWEIMDNLCNSMETRLKLVIELNCECIDGFY